MIDKSKVYAYCQKLIDEKRALLEKEMKSLQESSNNETKSSAGDKHETSRALAQAEQENLGNQFSKLALLQQALDSINLEIVNPTINVGSLVKTNNNTLFLGIPLGSIKLDGISIFAISTASPIGKLLIGKQAGDEFKFNSQVIKILEVI
ncbi:MAG: 3-oxoacyl-ACP synthase [Salibacteraceae bacterium]